MAQKVLIIGTAGAEDPTKATMPLVIARGLQETGNDCKIVLMGQGDCNLYLISHRTRTLTPSG